jgi:hypothetical protein
MSFEKQFYLKMSSAYNSCNSLNQRKNKEQIRPCFLVAFQIIVFAGIFGGSILVFSSIKNFPNNHISVVRNSSKEFCRWGGNGFFLEFPWLNRRRENIPLEFQVYFPFFWLNQTLFQKCNINMTIINVNSFCKFFAHDKLSVASLSYWVQTRHNLLNILTSSCQNQNQIKTL